jgi:hypothetical protein
MSEIDSKLVAQARPYPNGWVYVIDGVFPDGAAVRPERIVGEWKVGPDGIITGEYKANGKYHAFKFKLFRMRLPVKPGKAMPSEMLLPRSPMARASQRGKRFAAAGHRKIVSVLGEQWGAAMGPGILGSQWSARDRIRRASMESCLAAVRHLHRPDGTCENFRAIKRLRGPLPGAC